MELNEIMNQIKGINSDSIEKTASTSVNTEKTSEAHDKLLIALNDVLKTTDNEKVAESTVSDLTKMANDLASSESEALVKEAHLYGAAVADGFMSRLGQYESSTSNEKVASQDFEKFAADNPELVKQAIDLGYLYGKAQIEQVKEAVFNQGYNDASAKIAELQKTSVGKQELRKIAESVNSSQTIETELQKIAASPDGQQKLAEVKQGYDDTMNELTKMANEVFSKGYYDTINIVKAM